MVKDNQASQRFTISGWFAVSLVEAERAVSWMSFLSWIWLLWTCDWSMLALLCFHLAFPWHIPEQSRGQRWQSSGKIRILA